LIGQEKRMLVFDCPSCGAKLEMPDNLAGKKVRCGSCQQVATAPALSNTAGAIQADPPPPPKGAGRSLDQDDDMEDRPRRRGGRNDAAAAVAATGAGMGIGAIIAIVVCILGCLGGCGVVAVLVAMMVPAVQKVRTAAARVEASNNLKEITLACHNFHDRHGGFPTPKVQRPGNPPAAVDLSWRVPLLAFTMRPNPVVNRFDQTQAWDNPRNQPLLNPMPPVYGDKFRDDKPGTHDTFYQYFTGPGTLWPDNRPRRIMDITDGTSNTFLVAEASNGVPWSKPADIVVQPGQPLPLPADNFLVSFADGSVRFVDRRRAPDATLLIYINPTDGIPAPPLD
jgi:hypothetical protein